MAKPSTHEWDVPRPPVGVNLRTPTGRRSFTAFASKQVIRVIGMRRPCEGSAIIVTRSDERRAGEASPTKSVPARPFRPPFTLTGLAAPASLVWLYHDRIPKQVRERCRCALGLNLQSLTKPTIRPVCRDCHYIAMPAQNARRRSPEAFTSSISR